MMIEQTKDDQGNRLWLTCVRKRLGLRKVTAENEGEWLWRFVFAREIGAHPLTYCNGSPNSNDATRFASLLRLAHGVEFCGQAELSRDEFVAAAVADATKYATGAAVAAVQELLAEYATA